MTRERGNQRLPYQSRELTWTSPETTCIILVAVHLIMRRALGPHSSLHYLLAWFSLLRVSCHIVPSDLLSRFFTNYVELVWDQYCLLAPCNLPLLPVSLWVDGFLVFVGGLPQDAGRGGVTTWAKYPSSAVNFQIPHIRSIARNDTYLS